MKRLALAAVLSLAASPLLAADEKPHWLEPMRAVHAKFDGTHGYVAQLGDSITYSMAFWSPMGWADPSPFLPDDGLPKKPRGKRWRDAILGCRAKGPAEGNYSRWCVGNVLKAVGPVLSQRKPEVAILMVGTNDINSGRVPAGYREGLEAVIEKCLAAHCIPILNTIPPRRDRMDAVKACNEVIAAVARKHHVPLVDYHAEMLRRQPDKWLGTLISGDGVHPTGGKTHVYSDDNLSVSGYALRNWLNFLAYRRIYFAILHPEEAATTP